MSHYLPLAPTALDQCLRNQDLLAEILSSGARNSTDLASTRRTLYSAALTSKLFSECAVKLLWRRLSNILPLLRLLPTFRLEGEVYILPGLVTEEEWAVVHRYAAYVRDIGFTPHSRGDSLGDRASLDPSVYVLLAMRGRPLFPNLRRLVLPTKGYIAEMMLCLSSSIKSLTLESISDIWAETFLDRLASDGAHLSYLSLGNCHRSNPLLSKSIAFRTLRVLELCGLDKDITAAHLTEVGSLPALQSFVTDMVGWDGVELTSVARQGLFRTLTDLKINATPARLHRNVPDFLSVASSREMQSLSLGTSMGEKWEANTHSAATLSAIMRCIGARWATTLRHLDIRRIAGSPDDLAPLEEVTGLQNVSLKSVLHEPLSDTRILSVIRNWTNLRTLEIVGPGAEADIVFLRCLAEHCLALRTLRVAYTAAPPPPLDLTAPMTPHLLEELWFVPPGRGDIWNRTKITRLAQYFDHFFPHLVLIRGEGHMWWEEVEQLVFEYQDRRHMNSQMLM
ncbi:hypothetical protein C8F04DRAFT_1125398 [Mycena alexandri]|uniref:Uncharacterized protein n=1 Tax=Mycena alexandri TaxID=1745969 RepID=A0AAD6WWY6_9AGAR|nr:hypothetical protein C8F04DRAFT_1125398 [Mycena alexandri]